MTDCIKALLAEYDAGFLWSANGLYYGKRLNTEYGVGVLESPEQVVAGRVRHRDIPMGYGSGIEDLAYHNAMLLFALCDAEETTGDPAFAERARKLFQALTGMFRLAKVEGFVPRGPLPTAEVYYQDSSLDQHSLFVCGLWRYFRSRIVLPEERECIRHMVGKVVGRLEACGWSVNREDGSVPAYAGGDLLAVSEEKSVSLLSLLAIARDVTEDPRWDALYSRFSEQDQEARWRVLQSPVDSSRPRRYTMFYNQSVFRAYVLSRIESGERRQILADWIARVAQNMWHSPFFSTWRSMDWLGGEITSETPAEKTAEVQDLLRPLGMGLDSCGTVQAVFDAYTPALGSGKRVGFLKFYDAVEFFPYEFITLCTPAMVWQICLLGGEPSLIEGATRAVDAALARVDISRLESGWTANYLVLAALWRLARGSC
jgi:hypothetical protein